MITAHRCWYRAAADVARLVNAVTDTTSVGKEQTPPPLFQLLLLVRVLCTLQKVSTAVEVAPAAVRVAPAAPVGAPAGRVLPAAWLAQLRCWVQGFPRKLTSRLLRNHRLRKQLRPCLQLHHHAAGCVVMPLSHRAQSRRRTSLQPRSPDEIPRLLAARHSFLLPVGLHRRRQVCWTCCCYQGRQAMNHFRSFRCRPLPPRSQCSQQETIRRPSVDR